MAYMELHYDSDDKALAQVFILRKLTHLKACVNGNTLKFRCTQCLVQYMNRNYLNVFSSFSGLYGTYVFI